MKENCRDARGGRWIEDTWGDLRFAVRTLRKAPVFTAAVVAALTVCIGGNTAIFSIVDTVLFRPLSFPDQQHLVAVTEGVPGLGFPVMPFSCPDYLFVAANNRSFAATGVYRNQMYEISGAGIPHRVSGARVTASLFQVLKTPPAHGRAFTQEEDEHASRVAVLSSSFARNTFGSAHNALGRSVLLDRTPYLVIGVMPDAFSFPIRGSRFNGEPADVFVPVSWSNEDRQQTVSNFDYSMVARLKPNAGLPQARAEMNALVKRIAESYPPQMKQALAQMKNFSLESQMVPFREEFTGTFERPLLLLMAAVGTVLLIGCGDVANLMFSRVAGRRHEFAIRAALGAGRWRLSRQSLAEGLVLSLAGGAAGICLAFWTLPLLIRFTPPDLPRMAEVGLNGRMLLFAAAVTLATPVLFCLAPLTNLFRSGPGNRLPSDNRTSTQAREQHWMMSAGVVAQFALAFLLLTTAGLLFQSLLRASAANPGFHPERVTSARITLPLAVYKPPAQISGFFDRLLARVDALPGVREAGAISDLPINSSSNVIISMEGRGRQTERVDTVFCRGDALQALGIRLLSGRLLAPQDQVGGTHAVVISESLARRAWANQNPIGRHIRFGVDVPKNEESWLTVVGVVADVKAKLNSNSPRLLLATTWQDWNNEMRVVVRAWGDPISLESAIRRQIQQLDPGLAVGNIETVDQVLAQSLAPERFRTWLLICFATAALLLATLGIAGLLAYNATRRSREFGMRIALGATRGDLVSLVLKSCFRLSSTGVGTGLLASLAVTRALSALLYDTSPFDPATLVIVAAILLLVAFVAALVPAWRVMRTDPIKALKTE